MSWLIFSDEVKRKNNWFSKQTNSGDFYFGKYFLTANANVF